MQPTDYPLADAPRRYSQQLLLLDDRAHIVESCDSLFETRILGRQPVTEWMPFVESIFPHLVTMERGGVQEVLFSKVQEPHAVLPGFYDFSFMLVSIESKQYVLWNIYDYTAIYAVQRELQQLRNEWELQRQRLETKMQLLLNKSIELAEMHRAPQVQLLQQVNHQLLFAALQEMRPFAPYCVGMNSYQLRLFGVEAFLQSVCHHLHTAHGIRAEAFADPLVPAAVKGNEALVKYILYNLAFPNKEAAEEHYWSVRVYPLRVKAQENRLMFEVVTAAADPLAQAAALQTAGAWSPFGVIQQFVVLQNGNIRLTPRRAENALNIVFTLPFLSA